MDFEHVKNMQHSSRDSGERRCSNSVESRDPNEPSSEVTECSACGSQSFQHPNNQGTFVANQRLPLAWLCVCERAVPDRDWCCWGQDCRSSQSPGASQYFSWICRCGNGRYAPPMVLDDARCKSYYHLRCVDCLRF